MNVSNGFRRVISWLVAVPLAIFSTPYVIKFLLKYVIIVQGGPTTCDPLGCHNPKENGEALVSFVLLIPLIIVLSVVFYFVFKFVIKTILQRK